MPTLAANSAAPNSLEGNVSEKNRPDEHLVDVIVNGHRALEHLFQDYENDGHPRWSAA